MHLRVPSYSKRNNKTLYNDVYIELLSLGSHHGKHEHYLLKTATVNFRNQYEFKSGGLCNIGYLPETHLNTLRLRQNGRHFTDNIFRCIFFNENVWISIKISLKFVAKGPVNNIPLSEPMIVRLLMYICATWPQRVKHKSKEISIVYNICSCHLEILPRA